MKKMILMTVFALLLVVCSFKVWANEDISSVRAVTYSPNGNNFAVAANYNPYEVYWVASDISIYDSETFIKLAVMDAFWQNIGENIFSVAYSPDGQRIASCSSIGRVHIFNAVNGQLTLELEKQETPIVSVTFSPDSNTLVTGSADNVVKFWNATNGRLIRTINSAIAGQLQSLSYSPDGNMLAIGFGYGPLVGGVQVYNARNGEFIYMPEMNERREWDDRGIYSVEFSKDGSILAAGSAWGRVYLWEARTGTYLREWTCGSFSISLDLGVMMGASDVNGIISIAFSPDDQIIVSGSINGMIEVRNTSDGSRIGYTGEENNIVYSITYKPDGNYIISGTSKGWEPIRIR